MILYFLCTKKSCVLALCQTCDSSSHCCRQIQQRRHLLRLRLQLHCVLQKSQTQLLISNIGSDVASNTTKSLELRSNDKGRQATTLRVHAHVSIFPEYKIYPNIRCTLVFGTPKNWEKIGRKSLKSCPCVCPTPTFEVIFAQKRCLLCAGT